MLATGFDANTGGLTAIDLRDRDGRSLAERWARGVDTHLGMAVHGFPNMLFVYGPQSAAAFCNGPVCAELQGTGSPGCSTTLRAARSPVVRRADRRPVRRGPPSSPSSPTPPCSAETDSWYMGANMPGKPRQLLNYPSSSMYIERLRACAAAGYDGFVFEP